MTEQTYGDAVAPFTAAGWDLGGLRPLIPHKATLSSSSSITALMLGKIPGRYRGSGVWSGLVRWGESLDAELLRRALTWPTPNVGVLAGQVQCIDCDVDDAPVAGVVREALQGVLGPLQLRARSDSARWAAPVLGLPARLPLLEIHHPERVLGKVEFKGLDSGHWVVAGTHPRGGVYTWPQGIPQPAQLPRCGAEAVDAFRAALERLLEPLGLAVRVGAARKPAAAPGARLSGFRRPTSSLPQLLSIETLEELLTELPCNPETAGDWDGGVKIAAGFAAVLGRGGWPEAPAALVAWWATYPGTTESWFPERWASLGEVDQGPAGFAAWLRRLAPVHVGHELVERVLREIKITEARLEFSEEPDELAGEPPSEIEHQVSAADRLEELLREAVERYVYRDLADEWVDLVRMQFAKPQQLSQARLVREMSEAHYELEAERARRRGRKPPKPVPGWSLLLPRARHVSGVTYLPGAPRFIAKPGDLPVLNKWTGPARPLAGRVVREEEIEPWLRLLRHMFPDRRDRELFLDWASHLAQRAGVKLEWMLVLFSLLQGTGKDTILLAVRHAVGADNWKAAQLTDLLGTNNAHISECQVLYVMELPGGRQRDAVEILKARVASVAGERIVNPKFVAPYTVVDRTSLCASTNHMDSLDLSGDDRRTGVLHVAEVKVPVDLAREVYALYDLDGERHGLELIAEYLRQRQISAAFDPKRCPLASDTKEEMRLVSLEGTPAGHVYARVTQDEVPDSLSDRRMIWGRELLEAMDSARAHARYPGRRGQLQLAMELAGWRLPNKAGPDGRVIINAPRGGARRSNLKITVWVRAGDADLVGLGARELVDRLHQELRDHGRAGDAHELGQLLAKVIGGVEGEDEGTISLEERREKRRRAQKPSPDETG